MPDRVSVAEEMTVPRPRRADARRNFDALLAAASAAFINDTDTPLEDIAHEAGVGIGTLYRHFPNRDALIQAVYQTEVERLLEAAEALALELSPVDALGAWLNQFVEYAATKRGMSSALRALVSSQPELFEVTRTRMMAAMDMLVERAKSSGAIRNDIQGEDLIRAMSGICSAAQQPDWQEHAHRLVGLLLDGLRFGAPLA